MPTYLYECECGATEDVVRSLRDTEDSPKCKLCGLEMKRSYKFALTQFKGKGFAVND